MGLLPRFGVEILEHAYGSVGARRIVASARDFQPHFIYERYALANTAGVQARRQLEIPLFLEVNSPMVYEMERLGKLVFRRWARRVESEIFREADLILAVSGVLKRLLVEQGVDPTRILVIHNGVDPDLFPGPEEREDLKAALELKGRTLVGFSGFLRRWHRVDLALEALAHLIRQGRREVQLVVVGEGPGVGYLRNRAVALGIGDHVTVTGERPPEEVPRLVAAFDVAVLPAINPYASPLKLFDYLAAAVPVVAPDQENLREVVTHEETALLFEPGNSVSFEASLVRLLDDPEMGRRLGRQGRDLIRQRGYTWQDNARRVVEAYGERFGP
jgi:glycosyltransferase involved in cell wall biosynthesis